MNLKTAFLDIIHQWENRPRRVYTESEATLSSGMDKLTAFFQKYLTKLNESRKKMSIIAKIKEGFKDIATLDVVTVTGEINLTAQAGETTDWEKLVKDAGKLISHTDLSVVAFTHSQWDCDSVHFVKEGADAADPLIVSHQATVAAAHETRREAVKMLKEVADLN